MYNKIAYARLDLEGRQKLSEKRSRKFALVTYIEDTAEVIRLINEKRTSIRAYAVIKHDKDEADAHHHIVLRTHSAKTCTAVVKWFEDNAKRQNTFAQFVHDDEGILSYLTHEDEKDGYRYDKADIIDGGLSDLIPREDTKDDDAQSIVEDMLAGTSTAELVKKYGRDFIYHIKHYQKVVELIAEEAREAALKAKEA